MQGADSDEHHIGFAPGSVGDNLIWKALADADVEPIEAAMIECRVMFREASAILSAHHFRALRAGTRNPQKETTPLYPRSPYAVGSRYAYWITVNHREAYGMYACSNNFVNHESPTRDELFVTRKITRWRTRIKLGLQRCLYLRNLNSKRDCGARDYIEAQWLMLQQAAPEDFVIASGELRNVREFVDLAAQELGMKIRWAGEGVEENGFDLAGTYVVAVDPHYFRAAGVDTLLGDARKAGDNLEWKPHTGFPELVSEMVSEGLNDEECENLLKPHSRSVSSGLHIDS